MPGLNGFIFSAGPAHHRKRGRPKGFKLRIKPTEAMTPKGEVVQSRMKKWQRDELKMALAKNPNLDQAEMVKLAASLKVDLVSVKNWFRRRSVS